MQLHRLISRIRHFEVSQVYLNELFQTDKDVADTYSSFKKKNTYNNRVAIQEISKLLYEQESYLTIEELLKENNLNDIYNLTEVKLENDEAFKNLHRKFFDPFEYFIESIGLDSTGLNKQERTFVDIVGEKVHYFIFNTYLEDFENEKIRINNLISDNSEFSIIVYAPIKLELTHSKLDFNNDENVVILDIEPKTLFILMVMYKENFDLQLVLGDIITKYTRQKL